MATRKETKDPAIIIAIDFGTTFSGVAHSYVPGGEEAKAEKVVVVQEWSGSNQTAVKVPTRFSYAKDESPAKRARVRKSQRTATTLKWGYELEPGDNAIECIKLHLQKDCELPKGVRHECIEAELKKHGKTAREAASDYLREIHRATEESLTTTYGANCVMGTTRQTVLTVPAMWSDTAKDLTKQIAMEAGFPSDLILVSEPEAAAVWTLQATPWLDAKVGDNFIVCDAGGGTVDLISYEIGQLAPFQVKESVAGSGGLCGGSFLNKRFEQRLSDKIGLTAFSDFKRKNPESWDIAMKYFDENAKRNFNPEKTPSRIFSNYCAGIPDCKEAGTKNNFIKLTSADLSAIFERIITEVLDLIGRQVSGVRSSGKSVKKIILVGGFGQSKHLMDRVKAKFVSPGIEVLQPPDAWSAVVRGAVLLASQNQQVIQSRKARQHYGVAYSPNFDPKLHPPSSKFWDSFWERYLASGRYKSFIEKGKTLLADEPITHAFCRRYCKADAAASLVHSTELLASMSDSLPSGSTDFGLRTVCTLHANLTGVPALYWTIRTNSKGLEYETVSYDLKMQLESGGLRFWIEIDGTEYGTVTAEFK